MASERNALAELAEELRVMSLDVVGDEETVLDKAYRIIAELAKVECQPPDYIVPYDGLAYTAYAKCRAIAEEETLEAEDYGQWLKKWAKTKGYAK